MVAIGLVYLVCTCASLELAMAAAGAAANRARPALESSWLGCRAAAAGSQLSAGPEQVADLVEPTLPQKGA